MHVTAVVVSHNGGDYLPRTLAALSDQTRSADAAIGIDTGSTDNSLDLLREACGQGNVTTFQQAKSGFGAAVQAGLQELAPAGAATDGPASQTKSVQWIWLLHDDAAPAPDALAELLHAVERAPSVTVAGCKQLGWDNERHLVDVGLSTSRWAERLTLIDADEVDQGQYDARSDTFAVNSAGMLIRRDVWEQLQGFDPALPGSGDDVDFCWRNWLAGNRVVVVPSARMFHVEHRPHGLGTSSAARKAQIHVRLKHTPWWNVPFQAIGALFGAIVRLVLSILVKEPGYGFSQFTATVAALIRPLAVVKGRRVAAATRRVHRSVIRGLQTSTREVRANRRSLLEAIRPSDDNAAVSDLLAPEPSGDAADDFAALATNERGWVGTGAVAAALLALAAALVGLLGLVRSGTVAGGGLLPLSAAPAEIWANASTWWISLGAGLPGHGDPFGYVLWLLSLFGGGDGNSAMAWLLVLAMPLSALGAWFAAGALTTKRRFRTVAALAWSAAPALLIAINDGRVGALFAHVMMPLLLLSLLRASGSAIGQGHSQVGTALSRRPAPILGKPGINGTPSWTAAAAAGLAMAVVTASAPSLMGPIAVAVILAAVILGQRGKTLWWSLLPTIAIFLPYGISVLDRPRALLADPGVPLTFEASPLWQQLLGQPLAFDIDGGLTGLAFFGPGAMPWALLLALLVSAPVLILAVTALFLPGKRTALARVFWLAALAILVSGWLVGHVATGVNNNVIVGPYTGPAVSAAGMLLLAAAVIGAEKIFTAPRRTSDSDRPKLPLRRVASGVVLTLLVAGPLASMGAWAAQNVLQTSPAPGASPAPNPAGQASSLGSERQVWPVDSGTLPATAVDRGQGPERTRTLVITSGEQGAFTSSLMRGAGTTLDGLSTIASARTIIGAPGREEIATDDAATASLRKAVATIVASTGVDPRADLEQLGAGFVVLKAADSAAQLTASRIDAVPGLVAVGQTDAGWLWRVTPRNQPAATAADAAHRVRIVDSKNATVGTLPSEEVSVDATVPSGEEGRKVVLAERSDPGWSAWLDGRQLKGTTAGWSQAFELPAAGGDLEIRYTNPWALWFGILQAVVIGLTVLLAIPMPARRTRTGMSRDEVSLRKEYSSV
ncbi:Glycosyltransferase, GT2 family [Arthrobacter sp. yr096]|uniref:glycosyltransferase family 2 protein n=1 Tax=Arthrobacter sp. yr096 TaxID=1761750 RepID=UPI0008C37B48|nr:glycosyltransferase family 2 protein [Arthrobacter sp. yr096]SEI72280.1 Glycosyltransferase, GT2 family [Arthrobacter sp. yr096]